MPIRISFAAVASSVVVLASLAIGCGPAPKTPGESVESSEGAATETPPNNAPAAEATGSHVGVHGMVLFGSDRFYLSHIPLYDAPHNIQVIVEVKIVSGVPVDQQLFGTKNFTVKPAAFSLHDLAHGALTNVTGTIYLGNFESGGTPAFRNVKFEVTRVIFERAMSSSMPSNVGLDYIAVGTPAQPYFVHLIDAPPSFDQVVAVRLPSGSFLDASTLEKGTLVRVAGGQPNTVTRRLKPQATVDVTRQDIESGDAPVNVEVLSENSCLPGRDFYGTCPAAQ